MVPIDVGLAVRDGNVGEEDPVRANQPRSGLDPAGRIPGHAARVAGCCARRFHGLRLRLG